MSPFRVSMVFFFRAVTILAETAGRSEEFEWKSQTSNSVAIKNDSKLFFEVAATSNRSLLKRSPEMRKLWLTKGYSDEGNGANLMKSYAMVVKDEAIRECGEKADEYTEKRHFVCSAVILSGHFLMTSASCAKKAFVTTHNLRADVAALVAALTTNIEVIRIVDHEIHPNFDEDYDSPNYARNNLAILKLECRISSTRVIPAKLPIIDLQNACYVDKCDIINLRQKSFDDYSYVAEVTTARNVQSPTCNQESRILSKGARKNPWEFGEKDEKPMNYMGKRSTSSDQMEDMEKFIETGLKNSEGLLRSVKNFTVSQILAIRVAELSAKFVDAVPRRNLLRSTNRRGEKGEIIISLDEANDNFLDKTLRVILRTIVKEIREIGENSPFSTNLDALSCPPIGTPVISDGQVVGIVLYTCQVVKPSVKLRYANVLENVRWIKETLVEMCDADAFSKSRPRHTILIPVE